MFLRTQNDLATTCTRVRYCILHDKVILIFLYNIRVTVRSMMGDFGGHSLLFEIIPLDDSQIEEDTGRQEYKYEVFLISFFTTDEIIVKFIILLCWIAITVPTILFCCCGCCGCCRSKKVKTD